jgi:hypothetical protein
MKLRAVKKTFTERHTVNAFPPVIATFLDRFIMDSLRLTKVFLKRVIASEYIQFVQG